MKISASTKHPVLQLGSTGRRVEVLEKRLKALGDLKGPADDRFDARTAAAVVKYKKEHGYKNFRPRVGTKMAVELKLPEQKQPNRMKGASYNCKIHRNPAVVGKTVAHFLKSRDLDFMQLQEISGYHDVLKKIPGYKLITFPGSKDHGETGVLVRDEIAAKNAQSIEAATGWTNTEGGVAQPRAATSVKLAGWLRVASIHAPPGIDWKNGHPVGGDARIKSYQSLTQKLARAANRNPDVAMLYGGDWNEGARTGGPGSPSWLAAKAGMKKYPTGGIDWEMARGCVVKNLRRGPNGGSDHPLVTFTVVRGR